jgi:hypothetical protein
MEKIIKPVPAEAAAKQPKPVIFTPPVEAEITEEFSLVGKTINCTRFAALWVKLENTSEKPLTYKIVGGNDNSVELIELIKKDTGLEAGADEDFVLDNLSWKYVGVYAKGDGASIRLTAEQNKAY